jgi:hypothetical protein
MGGYRRAVFAFALQRGDDFAPAFRSALGSLHIAREHADPLEAFREDSVFLGCRLQRAVCWRRRGVEL